MRNHEKKLGVGAAPDTSRVPALLPVRVMEARRGEPVTVLLRSGHILKVGRDFDESRIRARGSAVGEQLMLGLPPIVRIHFGHGAGKYAQRDIDGLRARWALPKNPFQTRTGAQREVTQLA